MKYFPLLKHYTYSFIVLMLIQAVGITLAIFITGKAPLLYTIPLYQIFFSSAPHETSLVASLIVILITSLIFTFSPFIRDFLLKRD